MNPTTPLVLTLTAALALLSSACDDPLLDPQVITGLRIVGAQVQADAEPQRSQLQAGESAQVQWLVTSDRPSEYQAQLVWCLAEETSFGLQRCARAPFAEQVATADTNSALAAAFTLPNSLRGAQHWLAWLGVCQDATPSFNWRTSAFKCDDGEPAVQGVYEGPLSDTEPNLNPELSDDRFTVDGETWAVANVAPGESCADSDLPRAKPGEPLLLQWRAESEDRQALPATDDFAAPERESLTFTHLATASGLERAFSAIGWEDSQRSFELDFTLDAEFDPAREGESIAVFLLVTDERGGSDWEQRALCAVP